MASRKIPVEQLRLTANVIRGLAMDGVQKANSGHPGMPMGMADVATVLFLKHLNISADDPEWVNRDRFVLSAGHGSMLLYSLLHLSGYGIPLEELKQFRQWDSMTPGHPEFDSSVGVETTTGPLGQGCGNAVGMTLAEHMLAARFNTDETELIDHTTYVIASDGDLMEGVSHEAFSLAGHLKLGKLIVLYDSNHITIEGETRLAYSDDVKRRFQGYNWRVLETDAHDYDAIDKAIRKAQREKERPTLIICHSHIAQGSPNMHDTAASHGAPLGEDEVKASKENLGLPPDQSFYVPDEVKHLFEQRRRSMKRRVNKWNRLRDKYLETNPDKAELWKQYSECVLPEDLESRLPAFQAGDKIATRAASGKVIQAIAKAVPFFVGGSADLAPSTKTLIDGEKDVEAGNYDGRNLRFGVREHGMCAVVNGMMLHGGFRVFAATFFVFSDYCRPSIRLAAIMKLPVIYVFTHDSFYVGEDGPTHEPVEHLAALRCMPNITMIRPSDATETAAAWAVALRNTAGPTVLLLTRQGLATIDRTKYPPASELAKGAYVLWQSTEGDPEVVLIASGSEVELALRAGEQLAADYSVRVVSMPSWELFERQDPAYGRSVIPETCKAKLAIEAGAPIGWERYTGAAGRTLCMERFGASGPYKILAEKFGFTTENVVSLVKQQIGG